MTIFFINFSPPLQGLNTCCYFPLNEKLNDCHSYEIKYKGLLNKNRKDGLSNRNRWEAKAKSVLVKKLIGKEKGKRDRNVRLPITITVLME